MQKKTSARGIWLVVAMVLIALAGAIGARIYWKEVARRTWGDGSAQPPSQQPEDAASELDALRQRYRGAVSAKQDLAPVAQAAQRLVKQYPDDAGVQAFTGMLLLETGSTREGYDHLVHSLELEPEQPEVAINAGTVAIRMGLIDDAVKYYQLAVDTDPTSARFRVHLAQAYLEENDLAAAQEQAQQALTQDSNSHAAHALMSDVLGAKGQWQQALEHIALAAQLTPLSQRPKQVIYLRKKARVLREMGQVDQALQALGNLTANERRSDDAVLDEIAASWGALEQPGKAAQAYEDAMVLRPNDWTLMAGAAKWRIESGDLKLAKTHLELLRTLNPRAPQVAELEAQLAALQQDE